MVEDVSHIPSLIQGCQIWRVRAENEGPVGLIVVTETGLSVFHFSRCIQFFTPAYSRASVGSHNDGINDHHSVPGEVQRAGRGFEGGPLKLQSDPSAPVDGHVKPSFGPRQGESVIVGVLGTHTYPDNALACHGDNTPTDNRDPPGKEKKKAVDFRLEDITSIQKIQLRPKNIVPS